MNWENMGIYEVLLYQGAFLYILLGQRIYYTEDFVKLRFHSINIIPSTQLCKILAQLRLSVLSSFAFFIEKIERNMKTT